MVRNHCLYHSLWGQADFGLTLSPAPGSSWAGQSEAMEPISVLYQAQTYLRTSGHTMEGFRYAHCTGSLFVEGRDFSEAP